MNLPKGGTLKTLKLFAILLSLSVGLAACEPIKGTLQVLQAFTAKVGNDKPCPDYEYPCDNVEAVITVQPGSHSMSIDMLGKDLVQIKLSSLSNRVIEMKVPRGKEIPATGSFSLSSQESGQPFDLNAQTNTTVSRTEETHTDERCEIPYQEYVCHHVGNPPRPHCQYETHYRPGLREVSFYYETTRQDMTAQLAQKGAQVAHFNGSRSETEKIYTYQGYCRPRHW